MKGKILVTDTLFIFDEHVKLLEDAGYEVIRVEKPDMNEAELTEAVKDKVGYILGGIEYVTKPVIDAATSLKAIVFTGTGFKGHIPAWEYAQEKGIKIGTTPYANVYEVAEWALAATLAMQRDLFSLGPQGKDKFYTVSSLPDLTVGIIGLGHIGKQYADMISAIGAKKVIYWNRSDVESNYQYFEKDEVFKKSDIIFVALGDEAQEAVTTEQLVKMKKGALLVSIAHHGVVNEADLSKAIKTQGIRAALDIVKDRILFEGMNPREWYASNSSAAYNSVGYLQRSSDMAVDTLIKLL
jgi:phosphoglycerate dehydrogenase-like enzyme